MTQRSSLHMPPMQAAKFLEVQRQTITTRRINRETEVRRQEAIIQFEALQCRAADDQVEALQPALRERSRQVLVIPLLIRPEQRPEPETRARYLAHLRDIAAQAERLEGSGEDGGTEESLGHRRLTQVEERLGQVAGLREQSDALCAACQGGCCTRGGFNGAYLTVQTARRLLDEHPEWTASDLVEAWASRLPAVSIADSCPNQTSEGCALPRELRSKTCNGFYCESLKDLQLDAVRRGGLRPVIALQRHGDHWGRFEPERNRSIHRLVIVDGNTTQRFDAEQLEFPRPETALPEIRARLNESSDRAAGGPGSPG